ncbi:MAG: ribosome silencing factor [Treponema sp.]|jgi:ribosome-associated protein|nr:ribosome silencing factor [Treponema sp.]
MDGSLPEIRHVEEICRLLEDHKGGAVTALDLRELHSWTDFFIIATVTSSVHLQGLLRHLREYAGEQGLALPRGPRKSEAESSWSLLDMGTALIHLMNAQAREFYELEELWNGAKRIYP